MGDTEYVVLREDNGPTALWEQQTGTFRAHSADAACRIAAEKLDSEGTYVAVPARSWNPTEQTKQTTTVWKSAKA
jgi:hypothetical protein